MRELGSTIMSPLFYAVSAMLLAWKWLIDQLAEPGSGWSWWLALVGLVVTVRAILSPLTSQEFRSRRQMQLMQPQIRALQEEFRDDRKRLTQEQKRLWKESGTNPFGSCLPLIVKLVIWTALWILIDRAARLGGEGSRGFMSAADSESLANAEVLGCRLGDTFSESATGSQALILILIAVIVLAEFVTQYRLLRDTPPEAKEGPYAQQQKFLLYALPVVFAIGGLYFPIAVLVFWATWYVWAYFEEAHLLRRYPLQPPPAHGRQN